MSATPFVRGPRVVLGASYQNREPPMRDALSQGWYRSPDPVYPFGAVVTLWKPLKLFEGEMAIFSHRSLRSGFEGREVGGLRLPTLVERGSPSALKHSTQSRD